MDSIFLYRLGQLFPRLRFSADNCPYFPSADVALRVVVANAIHALVALRHCVGVLRSQQHVAHGNDIFQPDHSAGSRGLPGGRIEVPGALEKARNITGFTSNFVECFRAICASVFHV
jgi:hypothetical protein